jgi:hypothetical protein
VKPELTGIRGKTSNSGLFIEAQVVTATLSMCTECGLPLRGPRKSKQPSKVESTNIVFINLSLNSLRVEDKREPVNAVLTDRR